MPPHDELAIVVHLHGLRISQQRHSQALTCTRLAERRVRKIAQANTHTLSASAVLAVSAAACTTSNVQVKRSRKVLVVGHARSTHNK